MTYHNLLRTIAIGAVIAVGFASCGGKKSGGGESSAALPKGIKAAPASDFNYDATSDGKGVVITKYTGDGGIVVIPAEIEGLPVVHIGNVGSFGTGVFQGNTRQGEPRDGYNITAVVIPASVTSIHSNGFYKCEKLTSVTFLGTGVTLGYNCFSGCINLSDLKFPDGEKVFIPEDESSGFEGCTKLPLAVRGKLKEMGFEI